MKKVLLTGGTGFIGAHCIGSLLQRGYEVHAVASRSMPEKIKGVTWHQADLLQSSKEVVQSVKPTHLLHLAWYVVPGKLISSPENFAWVTASMELLRNFIEQGGQRATVCGSGYEYDWNYGYCSEKLTPLNPSTVYGSCKHALHLLSKSLAGGANNFSLAWARVFFLYGPREHPDRLVSSVIRSLIKDEPAKCSHGKQIRDYMHVQDVASGLVAVLDSQVDGAINVSSGQATTLREIVLKIGEVLQKPDLIKLGALPARANDTALVVGDNARLVAEAGWREMYDLDAGLRHTIDWWKERGAA
jgi:nucleoside-diphosphate-sugar epimerase